MPALPLLHNTISMVMRDTPKRLIPRYQRKNRMDMIKFGSGYVRRWQFALIIVAIVLAVVLIAYGAYRVYTKQMVKHPPAKVVEERREFEEYVESLRSGGPRHGKEENNGDIR
ncbi:hypothetical protein BKA66DRAFT_443603 [Pyrenochaeta sp. MPI-SDFR-AT-0127]|nr:hypothetical protein BKA66DRAFT_443603 [Pyrenochaeta sp. MPI-SDFR-AT-0127]